MTGRERVRAIISRVPVDRPAFWLGNPHADSWPIYHRYFHTENEEELRLKIKDDVRWICPQFFPGFYRDPLGRAPFGGPRSPLQKDALLAPLADCESLDEVEAFDWPDPAYLHFDDTIAALRNTGNFYRLSGMWTSFYHDVMFLFGMENYLIKMYTDPDVVEAVTRHVCEFYFAANRLFFERAGDLMDGFFFGNDFGTQQDLIIGPEQFDRFIMPWFRKFTEQGHHHGYQVILHSCGAVHKVIDRLIDAGVDCLHPIQAKAHNMDAAILARDFGGRIAFMGGIDTQDLLINATPEAVKEDVRRVKKILGPHLIVSPSHEALLPNIPPQNVEAMIEAAFENEISENNQ